MYLPLMQIHTIKPQYQHLINLFASGTYRNYVEQSGEVPQLNEKQLDSLRRLSILTAFKGIQVGRF
jgi:hypothetical protein